MLLSFNKGECIACSTAFVALPSPDAIAVPIIATPLFFITVVMSAKSVLMCIVVVIMSAIPLAAVANTSSA